LKTKRKEEERGREIKEKEGRGERGEREKRR
jgi:hypothetical protein